MGDTKKSYFSYTDLDRTVAKCKDLIEGTEKVCDAITKFCDGVSDLANLGANISATLPIVASLRNSVKDAKEFIDNDAVAMVGYLRVAKEDSEETINMD